MTLANFGFENQIAASCRPVPYLQMHTLNCSLQLRDNKSS